MSYTFVKMKKKVCTTYYKFQIEQNMKNKKAKI